MFSLIPRRTRGEIARAEPLDWFRREFSTLFDRAFPTWPTVFDVPMEARWGVEMDEKENEYLVRAEMPGFEANEIDVNLTGNALTIRAEHRLPEEKAGTERTEGKEVTERTASRLERTLTAPEGVDPEGVTAQYRNGMLEVHLPKAPGAKPRRIDVKT